MIEFTNFENGNLEAKQKYEDMNNYYEKRIAEFSSENSARSSGAFT